MSKTIIFIITTLVSPDPDGPMKDDSIGAYINYLVKAESKKEAIENVNIHIST